MKKNKVVIFTRTNARILTNPKDMEKYEQMPNAIVNPDLSRIIKIPTHFWKLINGQIVEMSRPEKLARMEVIEETGVDNKIRFLELKKVKVHKITRKYYKVMSIVLLGLLTLTWGWVLWPM